MLSVIHDGFQKLGILASFLEQFDEVVEPDYADDGDLQLFFEFLHR